MQDKRMQKRVRLSSHFPDLLESAGHSRVKDIFLPQLAQADEKLQEWLAEAPEHLPELEALYRYHFVEALKPVADQLRGKPITRAEQRAMRYEALNLLAETVAQRGEPDWLYCAEELSARIGQEISPARLRDMVKNARKDILQYVGIPTLTEELQRMDTFGHVSVVVLDDRGDFVRITREAILYLLLKTGQ